MSSRKARYPTGFAAIQVTHESDDEDIQFLINAKKLNHIINTSNSDSITISQLLALGVPDIINYTRVNATFVSDEQIANVTNYAI